MSWRVEFFWQAAGEIEKLEFKSSARSFAFCLDSKRRRRRRLRQLRRKRIEPGYLHCIVHGTNGGAENLMIQAQPGRFVFTADRPEIRREREVGKRGIELGNQRGNFFRCDGTREQKPLQVIALEALQAHGLGFGLDAFRNNRVPQSVGHVDDRLDDRVRCAVAGRLNKRAVDLDGGRLKLADARKGGMAGSKIVN